VGGVVGVVGAGKHWPLSPAMAWAVILLASGDDAAAEEMAGRSRYAARTDTWLRDHPLREYALQFRARAESEEFKEAVMHVRSMAVVASVLSMIGLSLSVPFATALHNRHVVKRTAAITGHVYAQGGPKQHSSSKKLPMSGVAVILSRVSGTRISSTKTPASGVFSFSVPPGTYVIAARLVPPMVIPGRPCQSTRVKVKAHKKINLQLYCDIK
jgi:hypothetical protein